MKFFVSYVSPGRVQSSQDPEDARLKYNACVARMRTSEYPMLEGTTYLDHGGTTLASKSLLDSFSRSMQSILLANPHSDAANPSASSVIVAETRRKVLDFFNANPDHFDVVFAANATAATKLVMDCFAGYNQGFDYYYHRNCHTSLVGVRELAKRSHCLVSNAETESWLNGELRPIAMTDPRRPTLFAYPAQSNMSGERLPQYWPHRLRSSGANPNAYTLLDVAAHVTTSPLDLSDHVAAPDFVALSFYKIFGFPDLGALLVRKASSHILEHRKYFGGGTTEMLTCFGDNPWVARKEASLHARLEDGTIAIRSILALRCAFDVHRQLFGSMIDVSRHTAWLAKTLYDRLIKLRHSTGVPVCHIYKAETSTYGDSSSQGATIALNVTQSDGSWMGPYAVGAMLRASNIHIRTGSVCNPAGMACILGLAPTDIRRAFDEGFRCNQQEDIREGGVLFGVVRVTLGAMSTLEDIDRFARFVEEHLMDQSLRTSASMVTMVSEAQTPSIREKSARFEARAAKRQFHGTSREHPKQPWKAFRHFLYRRPNSTEIKAKDVADR